MAGSVIGAKQDKPTGQGFSFRTSVELINVTATVTDAQGRFVPGLTAADFEMYEDGKLQTISQFESQRVPVSLGMALDTSGSMAGERFAAAQSAVNRFLYDLLGEQDEVFLYRFDSRPVLVRGWTEDRASVGRSLQFALARRRHGDVRRRVGRDAAVPVGHAPEEGARRDFRRQRHVEPHGCGRAAPAHQRNGSAGLRDRHRRVRFVRVVVRLFIVIFRRWPASSVGSGSSAPPQSAPVPAAFPGAPVIRTPPAPARPAPSNSSPAPARRTNSGERFNADALRSLTDDTGGRTEIIVSARDLDPATAGIANELSRQYFIGYSTSVPKDGRWHTIDVKLQEGQLHDPRAQGVYLRLVETTGTPGTTRTTGTG